MYLLHRLKIDFIWVLILRIQKSLLYALGFLLLSYSFFLNSLHFALCWRDILRSLLHFLLFLRHNLLIFSDCRFFDNSLNHSLLCSLFLNSLLDSLKELAQITAYLLSFIIEQAVGKLDIQICHFFRKIFKLVSLYNRHVFSDLEVKWLLSLQLFCLHFSHNFLLFQDLILTLGLFFLFFITLHFYNTASNVEFSSLRKYYVIIFVDVDFTILEHQFSHWSDPIWLLPKDTFLLRISLLGFFDCVIHLVHNFSTILVEARKKLRNVGDVFQSSWYNLLEIIWVVPKPSIKQPIFYEHAA